MTTFLQALNAPDLGLMVAGQDFAATQDMTEEMRQEVTYRGGFGSEGPIIRQVRFADEGTISFSAILTRQGVARGLNSEKKLKTLRDFEVITQRGAVGSEGYTVYPNCNWTRISIASALDAVTLSCDISVPGFQS